MCTFFSMNLRHHRFHCSESVDSTVSLQTAIPGEDKGRPSEKMFHYQFPLHFRLLNKKVIIVQRVTSEDVQAGALVLHFLLFNNRRHCQKEGLEENR